jgi:bifunctional UDP-N-acetylglucosamine pyrophosphorylase/glucosamine-1-phosphate N-acetyltransferase
MKKFQAVILAAGKGTRMKSALAKVLHPLALKPLIGHVIASVAKLRPEQIVVVLGHGSDEVEKYLAALSLKIPVKIVYQKQQLGSGHALMQARAQKNNGNVLVLSGDVPLIQTATLKRLLAAHDKNKAGVSVLTADVSNPSGYGRIVKGSAGIKIVEEKDASPEEKKITEINSGIYCFDKIVWDVLPKIKNNNAKKEYYITDAVELIQKSLKACTLKAPSEYEIKGINTRKELSEAETYLQAVTQTRLMEQGVTIISPLNTYISPDAVIGQDTVIYPNVFISAGVKIGKNCHIGAGSYIANSVIADDVKIEHSYINSARVASGVKIGPFAHIRPGAVLGKNVRVGNFSEIKKSVIGEGAKVNHLSYIGDSSVGKNVNVGAGTITCNYDGKTKSRTVIGEGVFVGSNVNFVAPVKVGKNALIAAGSTVTGNVPQNTLVIARARQMHKTKKK